MTPSRDIILEFRKGGYLSVSSDYVAKNLDKIKADPGWDKYREVLAKQGVTI
jgi:hypothetical protein